MENNRNVLKTRSVLKGGDYYRGLHGEIRRKKPKIHLTKKRRRYLRRLAKEECLNEEK